MKKAQKKALVPKAPVTYGETVRARISDELKEAVDAKSAATLIDISAVMRVALERWVAGTFDPTSSP